VSHVKTNEAVQLFPKLIINQHIRMISEGSCDTEDWGNNADDKLCFASQK